MKSLDLERMAARGTPAEQVWGCVLLLAIRERASRTWYDPAQGDSRLGFEVDGVNHDLIPPPAALEADLPGAMVRLLERRTAWEFLASLFGGGAAAAVPVESAVVAKVEGAVVTVSVTCDLRASRVEVRLSPTPFTAAAAAGSALRTIMESQFPSLPR